VESPGTRLDRVRRNWDFFPRESSKVEDPDIIEICYSFSSEDHKIWVCEFCYMVCPFPRRWITLKRGNLQPV